MTENKAKHGNDEIISAPVPKAIVPSKFVPEPALAQSSTYAAPAASGPAVDLDDYVPMEEFDKYALFCSPVSTLGANNVTGCTRTTIS